ncbi:hypothetical protein J2S09_004975 [Bacillus fengqiuensis]|nr:hypothetical protein [Bacillus fengqiuensis]
MCLGQWVDNGEINKGIVNNRGIFIISLFKGSYYTNLYFVFKKFPVVVCNSTRKNNV